MILHSTSLRLALDHIAPLRPLAHLSRLLRQNRGPGTAERELTALLSDPTRHLVALAGLAVTALQGRDPGRACEFSDRLRRVCPGDALSWALAGLASLVAGSPAEALSSYRRAQELDPSRGDYLAGAVHACIANGDRAEAEKLAGALLAALSRPGQAYACLAEALLKTQIAAPAGMMSAAWTTSDGHVQGWAWHAAKTGERLRLELRIAGRAAGCHAADRRSSLLAEAGVGDGCHAFRIALPDDAAGELELIESSSGQALLGCPLAVPDYREGWLEIADERHVTGWVRHRRKPEEPVAIEVARGETVLTVTATAPSREWGSRAPRHALRFEADFGAPPPGALTLRYDVRFAADGRHLLGSPVHPVVHDRLEAALAAAAGWLKNHGAGLAAQGLDPAVAELLRRDVLPQAIVQARRDRFRRGIPAAGRPARRRAGRRAVDVIVPIYRGLDDTLACIESVLASRNQSPLHLVLIDDASPEAELRQALAAFARRGNVTLLRNDENLGFVASVNRGLALHPDRDAVLLNADTRVHGDWLDRLLATAATDPDIGTVTPLSNDATICSYPRFNDHNAFPDAAALAELDRLCAAANGADGVAVPTGVGFCLYIRRACLDDVGAFDVETWGRGYGEENDFCLKAASLGWRNVAATHVYVAHRGGVSFGGEGAAQLARNLKKLEEHHPGYARLVGDFIARDPLLVARRGIDLARLAKVRPGRSMLFVTHALGGGTERHVRDLAVALAAEGVIALILRPCGEGRVRLEVPAEWDAPNLVFDANDEAKELLKLLARLNIQRIHFHHFLDIPESLTGALLAGLDAPYDVTVHDYSWVCPQINLIDATGRYCGEPAIASCEACLAALGSRYLPGVTSVAALRRDSGRFLAAAQAVYVPSRDAGDRLARYFPRLAFTHRPHPEPALAVTVGLPPARPGQRLRIAVIGAIGDHKGYRELLACAEDAAARKLPIEYVVIGTTRDDIPLFQTGNIFVTGGYEEDELPALIRRARCDVALFLSVWPETWSYTLSAALANGLLPFAHDIGAFAERIRELGAGALFPLDLAAPRINDLLLRAVELYRRTPPRTVRLGQPAYGRILSDYYVPASRKPAKRKGAA